MDTNSFLSMLAGRNVPPEKIPAALVLAERFENYILKSGKGFTTQAAWDFSRLLIDEGINTEENFLSLARYGLFIKSNPIFIAFLEVLDGGEAQENLYNRVAECHGTALRDEVFAGIGVSAFGIPTTDKPGYMHPVIERLEQAIGSEATRNLLADSLRDLPDAYYQQDRELFYSCQDVDEYLIKKKADFLQQLETCQREGRLFFAQKITDEVVDYVRNTAEMGAGVRVGNIIYETKIPFMTGEYLSETDEQLKHYYYCHCPWAREAVKSGGKVAPIFCNCSAGFHKKPWEVIFEQPIHVDVLESILKGDDRCRFAIHLPPHPSIPT
ncbi:MAG: hypothetical protein CVU41_13235 [Chloroflexi bacterium HGW-Chloroflexi-3]|nr:MAG: hypothetical protein CVU41_13235 [Chloroflexi bacterium HGW-Chloroflexi-3]